MGLSYFARDVGRKLFDSEEEAADNIRQFLEARLTDIEDLVVRYDEGVVEIRGTCDSAEAKDLAILIAGDVKGVTRVNVADLIAPAPEPEQVWNMEYYVVNKGDTLSNIARRRYRSASRFTEILQANRGVLLHPDEIFPGQTIRIPIDTSRR